MKKFLACWLGSFLILNLLFWLGGSSVHLTEDGCIALVLVSGTISIWYFMDVQI